MASFANSDGCRLTGPSRNQRLAPLIGGPSASTATQAASATTRSMRRERPQPVVVEAGQDEEQRDSRERVEALLDEEVHRVALADRRRCGGGAEDHHEPERDETQRHEDEDALLELSHPERFATSRRNSSPRCSKLVNWSKLAQAGESRTTSPGRAACAARPTARRQVGRAFEAHAAGGESGRDLVSRLTDQVGAVAVRKRVRERHVALALAATAEDHVQPALRERRHRTQRRRDVGRLRVVDVEDAAVLGDGLDAVLDAGERLQSGGDRVVRNADRPCCGRCGGCVLPVVLAGDERFGRERVVGRELDSPARAGNGAEPAWHDGDVVGLLVLEDPQLGVRRRRRSRRDGRDDPARG